MARPKRNKYKQEEPYPLELIVQREQLPEPVPVDIEFVKSLIPKPTDPRFSRRQTLTHLGISCSFCRSTLQDQIYGRLEVYFEVSHANSLIQRRAVHTSCLYFASGFHVTKGHWDGSLITIGGYALERIIHEQRRGGGLNCSFCDDTFSTIGCHLNSCKINFHLNCAIDQPISIRPSFNYITRKSFCHAHRDAKNVKHIHSIELLNKPDKHHRKCPVCDLIIEVVTFHKSIIIQCPHCAHLAHLECLRKDAYERGPQFRCPSCKCFDEKVMKSFVVAASTPEPEEPEVYAATFTKPRFSAVPMPGGQEGEMVPYSDSFLHCKMVTDRENFSSQQCHNSYIYTCLRHGVPVSTNVDDWQVYKDNQDVYCAAKKCLGDPKVGTLPLGVPEPEDVLCKAEDNMSKNVINRRKPLQAPACPPEKEWHFILCQTCHRSAIHVKCLINDQGRFDFCCLLCRIRRLEAARLAEARSKEKNHLKNFDLNRYLALHIILATEYYTFLQAHGEERNIDNFINENLYGHPDDGMEEEQCNLEDFTEPQPSTNTSSTSNTRTSKSGTQGQSKAEKRSSKVLQGYNQASPPKMARPSQGPLPQRNRFSNVLDSSVYDD